MRAGISFPYLLLSRYLLPRPSRRTPRNLAFFRRFPRRAGCNPATPIVVDEGGGGWVKAGGREEGRRACRRTSKRRRASYYICNIFAFTIFQLVCILEPLLPLSPTLTWRSRFFPLPVASFFLSAPSLVDAALYAPSSRFLLLRNVVLARRDSFIREFSPLLFSKPLERGPQRIPFSQIIPKTR